MIEELKQKAKEWQKENCCKDCVVYLKEECNGDVICGGARGYITGATETTKELQEENERLAKHILELQADKDNLTDKVTELVSANQKITNLKKQIEKMKRCEMCKNHNWQGCVFSSEERLDCINNRRKLFELKE